MSLHFCTGSPSGKGPWRSSKLSNCFYHYCCCCCCCCACCCCCKLFSSSHWLPLWQKSLQILQLLLPLLLLLLLLQVVSCICSGFPCACHKSLKFLQWFLPLLTAAHILALACPVAKISEHSPAAHAAAAVPITEQFLAFCVTVAAASAILVCCSWNVQDLVYGPA